MIGEGLKLGVDWLWFKTEMNFQAPLTNSSEFFSSKASFPIKEQNKEEIGSKSEVAPVLSNVLKKKTISAYVCL